mgnify:CR=1 FL=1
MKVDKKIKQDEYNAICLLQSKVVQNTCLAAYLSKTDSKAKKSKKEKDESKVNDTEVDSFVVSEERKNVEKFEIGLKHSIKGSEENQLVAIGQGSRTRILDQMCLLWLCQSTPFEYANRIGVESTFTPAFKDKKSSISAKLALQGQITDRKIERASD